MGLGQCFSSFTGPATTPSSSFFSTLCTTSLLNEVFYPNVSEFTESDIGSQSSAKHLVRIDEAGMKEFYLATGMKELLLTNHAMLGLVRRTTLYLYRCTKIYMAECRRLNTVTILLLIGFSRSKYLVPRRTGTEFGLSKMNPRCLPSINRFKVRKVLTLFFKRYIVLRDLFETGVGSSIGKALTANLSRLRSNPE